MAPTSKRRKHGDAPHQGFSIRCVHVATAAARFGSGSTRRNTAGRGCAGHRHSRLAQPSTTAARSAISAGNYHGAPGLDPDAHTHAAARNAGQWTGLSLPAGNVFTLPTPSPTPCPTSGIAALHACMGNVVATGNFGTGFDQPEREPALYNLTFPRPVNTTAAYNQTFEVGRPAVTFQFPISLDPTRYGDVSGKLEPDVVWTMQITAEACLTSDEAPSWPNAQNLGTACDPEVNATNAARSWYSVGQFNTNSLPLVQHQVQTGQDPTLQVNLQQILTPMRFHYVGHDLTCCNSINSETVPVNVVVLPVALMQLKVIPFTIMYVPPGNASQAAVTMTTTYTTTQTAGATTSIDNTNKQDNWVQQEQKLHVGNTIFDVLGGQFDLSSSDKWDKSTTIETGQQASLSRSDTVSTATALTLGVAQPPSGSKDPAPGSAGTFQKEAFWNDLIVVIPHPQFGLWDFYGVMSMQMLGAASAGTDPHFPIRLRDLDACANAQAPFASGFPIPGYVGHPVGERLPGTRRTRSVLGQGPVRGPQHPCAADRRLSVWSRSIGPDQSAGFRQYRRQMGSAAEHDRFQHHDVQVDGRGCPLVAKALRD